MADRLVTATGKNKEEVITSLCNEGELWSPRSKDDAIDDIESETHAYHVLGHRGQRVDIRLVDGPSGKYLRTDPDESDTNNLDELPDC